MAPLLSSLVILKVKIPPTGFSTDSPSPGARITSRTWRSYAPPARVSTACTSSARRTLPRLGQQLSPEDKASLPDEVEEWASDVANQSVWQTAGSLAAWLARRDDPPHALKRPSRGAIQDLHVCHLLDAPVRQDAAKVLV